MRIVVTGATGNLGTSVVQALGSDETVEHIVGVARRQPNWKPPKTTFVSADIRSPHLGMHLIGADVLVQLAWAFQPSHHPLETWDVNVLGSIAAFEAAAEAGVRTIVYASSVGAYSPGPGRRVTENWPTHSMPTAAYGREKAYLERYLDAFELREPQIRVVRLRPCFVFKRTAASEQKRIFAGSLVPRQLLRPGRIQVVPVPAGLRFQAIHSDDVAEAVRLAVLNDVTGAFNIATDPVIDKSVLGELMDARTMTVPARAAVAAVGGAWRLRLLPTDDALLSLLLALPELDSERAHTELGWMPRRSGVEAYGKCSVGSPRVPAGPPSHCIRTVPKSIDHSLRWMLSFDA